MTKQFNLRAEERFVAALPVQLGGVSGLTQDVSVSGIRFEVDAEYQAGSEIEFLVEVDAPTGKMNLKCQGHIVRTEMHGNKTSVAVKITQSVLEAAG